MTGTDLQIADHVAGEGEADQVRVQVEGVVSRHHRLRQPLELHGARHGVSRGRQRRAGSEGGDPALEMTLDVRQKTATGAHRREEVSRAH